MVDNDITSRSFLQTVTHLKILLHVLTAVLVALLYGDSGINASKSVANVGLCLIGVCYLWYTSIMPSILKCKKFKLIHSDFFFFFHKRKFYVTVPSEVAILKKETFNNWYHLRTYFCANLLITTPIHVSSNYCNWFSHTIIANFPSDCSVYSLFGDHILHDR